MSEAERPRRQSRPTEVGRLCQKKVCAPEIFRGFSLIKAGRKPPKNRPCFEKYFFFFVFLQKNYKKEINYCSDKLGVAELVGGRRFILDSFRARPCASIAPARANIYHKKKLKNKGNTERVKRALVFYFVLWSPKLFASQAHCNDISLFLLGREGLPQEKNEMQKKQ